VLSFTSLTSYPLPQLLEVLVNIIEIDHITLLEKDRDMRLRLKLSNGEAV